MSKQSNEVGYVYILTNDSFREDWVKIGKSSRPVDVRSKELDNTAVPLPFNIYATIRTEKYHEVEKFVHKFIDQLTDLRIRQNREFFNVAPEVALNIFRDISGMIDGSVVTIYENNKPVKELSADEAVPLSPTKKVPRAKNFTFSMVGIRIGETITFDPTGIEVKVASDNTIEYEGRIYKLSPFVGTFMPEDRQCPSAAYQGPHYFSYKGTKLHVLRRQAEEAQHSSVACPERAECSSEIQEN